ncbi:DUF2065 family protein [Dasania sp. GY-MA-18]|uniref:DUF2065 family protein n=1 Tax=Dasania phycosphaerae TaxID=2950436 RepID=A0A9J6RNH3_9GAMM|nr:MULTISPECIES: DUF2065 family protein [Dasania]MCR8923125.1 DUF2065 family protein [Dasania sp. GY-MA-18]MCZ0865557.1 DUF2065 family protein [Dasania phycosphaerae]MCZ0869282.1 DUF2065 family protein [Dasania phycosphaerae]
MWQDLAIALSLVLVIEGILPFLSPRSWRDMIMQVAQLSERQLRIMGLASMLAGLFLLTLLK